MNINPRALLVIVFFVTACLTFAILGMSTAAIVALVLFAMYSLWAMS